jgi:flagellar basal-body rod protein FlgF
MDRLIYTSLTAMRGSMARQTAIANNLANANTPGFRADLAEAQSLWLDGQRMDSRAFASEEVLAADMKGGTVTATGRALDIALAGDALLAVQADNGEIGYTRRGDLMLSASGLLTTGDGKPVQGSQGPLTLPPADAINIDEPQAPKSSRAPTVCSACAAAACCRKTPTPGSSPTPLKARTSARPRPWSR